MKRLLVIMMVLALSGCGMMHSNGHRSSSSDNASSATYIPSTGNGE